VTTESEPRESYTAAMLTGAIVREVRERHKKSRDDFMQLGGWPGKSSARIGNIEKKDSWKDGDRDRVLQVFALLGEQIVDPGITTWPGDPVADAAALVGLTQEAVTQGAFEVIAEGYKSSEETPVEGTEPADAELSTGQDPIAVEDWDGTVIPVIYDEDQDLFVVVDPEAEPLQLPDVPHGGTRVSAGKLASFRRCRRQWWLAWYRELAPKKTDFMSARSIGNRVHRALAMWYVPDGQERVDPKDALERVIMDDWTQLANAARKSIPDGLDEETYLANVWDDYSSAITLERAMIEGYVEWLAESAEDKDLEVIASETPQSATLELLDPMLSPTPIPVQVVALLDVKMRRTTDNVRLYMDHKTTGSLTDPVPTLPMDPQMLNYHLVEWLNTAEGEARCDGALYNMLKKVKRTAKAKPPFFDRIEVRHNVHELESYRRRLLGETREILRAEAALNAGADPLDIAYPTPTSDCRWQCDFFPVCPMFDDGSRAEDMVAQLYERVDPWLRYDRLEGGNA
jgi:hypothetical protein